jgi:hypothetical protein
MKETRFGGERVYLGGACTKEARPQINELSNLRQPKISCDPATTAKSPIFSSTSHQLERGDGSGARCTSSNDDIFLVASVTSDDFRRISSTQNGYPRVVAELRSSKSNLRRDKIS